MLIKDQLKVRMDQLDMPVNELARRVGVSGMSVRHWLDGRNYPTKHKIHLIEEALTCKLDFSEGESDQAITVEDTLKKADIDTFIAISRVPPDVQRLLMKLAERFVEVHGDGAAHVDAEGTVPPTAPAPTSASTPVKRVANARELTSSAVVLDAQYKRHLVRGKAGI